MSDSTFLTRVELLNYKSITHCSVKLGPLMFLVGPNGAGKSNFLDALHFVADALNNSLDYAIMMRGGIRAVYRRNAGSSHPLTIRLHLRLPTGAIGYYMLRIRRETDYDYWLQTEECRIYSKEDGTEEAYYHVDEGNLASSEKIMPAASPDRLYLVAASGIPAFRPAYDALAGMVFYNLNPETLRVLKLAEGSDVLSPNGGNLARVLRRIGEQTPDIKRRIEEYLTVTAAGVTGVTVEDVSSFEILQFSQQFKEGKSKSVFPASSMSDGTLRALGILTALFQTGRNENNPLSLVGIEEPETALHPVAVEALLDAMSEASESKQILATSHSADLLDNKEITADMLLAVVSEDGVTKIGPIDAVSRSVIQDRLYTAGELMRQNQIMPDYSALPNEESDEIRLPRAIAV